MCDISVALYYDVGIQMGKEIFGDQTTGNLLILKYLGHKMDFQKLIFEFIFEKNAWHVFNCIIL